MFFNVVTEALDSCGCCQLTKDRLNEPGTKPGSVWHIFDPEDADKIRELLNKVSRKIHLYRIQLFCHVILS